MIVWLLLTACTVSAYLIYALPETGRNRIRTLDRVDSLIYRELAEFSVGDDQIGVQSISVDSQLTRKLYQVSVAPSFSKTHLHTELNQVLHPYNIDTPSRVFLPQNDLQIQVYYRNTVIRTIRLQTDPDLRIDRNPASILVAFDGQPEEALLQQIISFGEPISIVLKVNDPVQAKELQRQLSNRYEHITFWLSDDDGGNLLKNDRNEPSVLPKLQHLQKVSPGATILSFKTLTGNGKDPLIDDLRRSKLGFIDASNALLLSKSMGRLAFRQELQKLEQRARNRERPIAIISASSEAIRWLKQELQSFKKGGLYLTPPDQSAL